MEPQLHPHALTTLSVYFRESGFLLRQISRHYDGNQKRNKQSSKIALPAKEGTGDPWRERRKADGKTLLRKVLRGRREISPRIEFNSVHSWVKEKAAGYL